MNFRFKIIRAVKTCFQLKNILRQTADRMFVKIFLVCVRLECWAESHFWTNHPLTNHDPDVSQRHDVILVTPGSFFRRFQTSAIFFPLYRWGDRRHLNTCFCASHVLFCQEKEIFNFNGVQALEFLALWVKDLLNWSFDVRVSRGENDARSANCREPSDSAADKQQRQKSKLLRK